MRHTSWADEQSMKLLKRLLVEDAGGEVLEYALIAGLIVVAAVAAISSVGTKVLGRWTSIKNSV
jgi:Flp pilus assembly pilin Flp